MWILILYVYAGVMAKGDSVALLQVPNFQTQQACVEAGKQTESFVTMTTKNLKFVCVKQ